MSKGFNMRFRPLDILKDREVEEIQEGSLRVLENTGVRFNHKKALKILKKAGCEISDSTNLAKIPRELVKESLLKCPREFSVKARDPKHNIIIGGNTLTFATDPGMQRIEIDNVKVRYATKQEFDDAVKVYDSLEHLHIFHPNSPHTTFEGVPHYMASTETFAARTKNSGKINRISVAGDNDIFCIQIAQAVDGTPLCGVVNSPPLCWDTSACDTMFRALEAGFPITIIDGDVYGASSPVTIAGSLVHAIAELLSGVVLAQMVRPGTNVIVQSFTSPQNMRTGAPAFGNIGVALHDAGFNQVMRNFQNGIPTANLEPGLGNSKCIDFQNAYERSILGTISALSGCNNLYLFGCVHGELTSHPIQAILDDDIAGMIARFVEGIDVNEETLGIDLINQVGPLPGFYLGKNHTRKMWKTEQYVPKVADLLTPGEWSTSGNKTCIDLAKERMEKILATHKPLPLTPKQDEDVERILEEARSHFKKKMAS
jgi:trimethylamine---corrinoid protein Co-methyltransferase